MWQRQLFVFWYNVGKKAAILYQLFYCHHEFVPEILYTRVDAVEKLANLVCFGRRGATCDLALLIKVYDEWEYM